MDRGEAVELVRTCLKQIQLAGLDAETVSEDTRLIGGNSPLDSIALVSLIVEIEQQINERFDVSTTLADDRAMSEKRSPFRTVGALASFIVQRFGEMSAA